MNEIDIFVAIEKEKCMFNSDYGYSPSILYLGKKDYSDLTRLLLVGPLDKRVSIIDGKISTCSGLTVYLVDVDRHINVAG